ncbi:hypothetical protein O77CONTIG1_00452 [Leptolyngbya sp. O-77]|nr:hypothetical protein O77CONTIG1_00452 [Leptolyngbya sp. O-77]
MRFYRLLRGFMDLLRSKEFRETLLKPAIEIFPKDFAVHSLIFMLLLQRNYECLTA